MEVTFCIKENKVYTNGFWCPFIYLACECGSVLNPAVTRTKYTENMTKNANFTEFNDRSAFGRVLNVTCAFKQHCDLKEKYIEGSLYTYWIAIVKYSCLTSGKKLFW